MEPSPASDVVPYTYEPLPEGDFIRLMHLQPALNVDAPLRFTFSIGHIPSLVARYEAISYTWGEPILDHPLHIDDTCTLVTRNLHKALRRFRLPTMPRSLWADAVCINQKDDHEKSRQIPLMTGIFRHASRVLAWLDGGDEEERGMQVLNLLSRISFGTLHSNGAEIQPSERDDIGKFLSLSWFTRLWIIQEVVMNADVVLICQLSELSWLRLTIALYICANRDQLKPILVDAGRLGVLQNVVTLWRYHNMTTEEITKLRSSEQPEILELVSTFHQYGCTDARDRIFALYNVATDVLATAVRSHKQSTITPYQAKDVIYMDVDYSVDVRQVYQAFAIACIFSGRVVDIFEAAVRRTASQDLGDWPSWVPDWRRPMYLSWPYRLKPTPWSAEWDVSKTTFDFHGTKSNILSMTWKRATGLDTIHVIDTILKLPNANSVSSMVASLRTQLATSPSSLVDCLLESMGLGKSHPPTRENGAVTWTWETYHKHSLPLWVEFAAQRPRLFVANASDRTTLLLGIGSVDLLEGDEVAFYPKSGMKVDTMTEHCFLIRKKSMYTNIDGNEVIPHRLIGTAQIARYSKLLDRDAKLNTQNVILYLG